MKKYSLDSHKLAYHPRLVANFLEDKKIFPAYVEISPSGSCNHHCLFCNFNYLGHKGKFPKGRMHSLIKELSESGVKSIVFAGIGEPLLNLETIPSMVLASKSGIDVGLFTNGALIKDESVDDIVESLAFIRFSFNAGNAENYAMVHKTNLNEYDNVLNNIRKMVDKKREKNSKITIGVQYVLLPENKEYVVNQAAIMKKIGVDYFVVKHFYEHLKNEYIADKSYLSGQFMGELKKNAEEMSGDGFSFIVRDEEKLDRNRIYNKCYGLEFIAYIREDGKLFTCFAHQDDPKTVLGNIFEKSFKDVWQSKEATEAIDYINKQIQKSDCQANCRHHQINNYLWELKNPTIEHINFI